MISKTELLSSLNCTRGKLAKEINELIFNWHRLYGIDVGPNEIDDRIKDTLRVAAVFWKNLILSEAEGFRDSTGRYIFQKLLKEVLDSGVG